MTNTVIVDLGMPDVAAVAWISSIAIGDQTAEGAAAAVDVGGYYTLIQVQRATRPEVAAVRELTKKAVARLSARPPRG